MALGHLDLLQPLLDAGDDPDPGLREAILACRIDIVHLLLAYGATYQVNATSGKDLFMTCKGGHLELVKLVLDAGIDLEACGDKCMKLAIGMGSRQSAMYLWPERLIFESI